MLDAIDDNTEGGIDHTTVRVVPHGATDEERSVTIATVEEVTVVMVGISTDGLDDWIARLMDREIIERSDHGASP
ncbi:unannotated protein [freshwater metagenome]|uniref:Unannotated protein n=1 Tax=freshwater metagenome TaxID=449393 RepID=A0A6J6P190_9ZZZZ